MKKLKLLFISLVMTVALPGTSVLAEIGYMRDVNTGCGEITVDCSSCHNLNNFNEYTDNQGLHKSNGGEPFCSDPGTWSPVRLTDEQLLADAQLTTNAYFETLFSEFMAYMAIATAAVNEYPDDDKVNPFVEVFPYCPDLAPTIAATFSKDTGYLVRRVTNRTRNARNIPDDWQAKQLEDFERMTKQGKQRTPFAITKPDGSTMPTMEFEATAFTNEEDIEYFNYMRSITLPPLTKLPCLKCHGSIEDGTVTPDVLEAIEGLYPYDMALGYKAGDIRGAWTIKIPVVEGRTPALDVRNHRN
ncbi:MAG: hypothetical protein DRQ44_04815 [Gammaproteobacteria bacterium]|nr:MAG: hypothetical protein DRQ44_04815 [Gammaproteobacteria bacterium]